MTERQVGTAAFFLGLAVALAACATERGPQAGPAAPLRVGVTSGSPPYVFAEDTRLAGLEVDFARELATALGRRLQLVPLEWEQQIPALLNRRTDIIMSGMTITRARQVTLAFSQPYLRSGLLALVRRADRARYPTAESVTGAAARIGVISGTTGEAFVREHCPSGTLSPYQTPGAAVIELIQNRIDIFVHDAPVVLWAASKDEANLAPVLAPLNQEPLGWALRRDEDALRTSVDAVLARWQTDGTRARILDRWLPYWQRLESGR